MPDPESKKRWDAENVTMLSVKLFKNTDADIHEYMNRKLEQGIPRAALIKKALRYLMKAEQDENNYATD